MTETLNIILITTAMTLGLNIVTTCWVAAILNRTRRTH